MSIVDNIKKKYTCNFTVKELAKMTDTNPSYVRKYCNKHGLSCKRERRPYIYHRYDTPPSWYNPNKTAMEMAEIADCTLDAVRLYLSQHNLPYKQVYNCIPASVWYNPNLTAIEMSKKSGKPVGAIYMYLRRHNLPYKKLIKR